ncbi:MAG: molybdopterin molybdotransferase MoeA [Nitrospirae bacterium]|nr:molybdopterin molybdotransferase MoeA [Nitrospirota bacterium]
MRSVEEALKTVLDNIKVLGTERIPIQDSLGRVLGEDVYSNLFLPPWNNSAMDGYAVRWENVKNAAKENPAKLNVVGDIRAGLLPDKPVGDEEAIRIMTGAPVPEGADTVIRVEDTKTEDKIVSIFKASRQGENIRKRGENVKKGDLVLTKGTSIGPGQLGSMAMVGKPVVTVYRRPVVTVMSTGDELADFDEALTENKIPNSNSYAVASQVLEAGATPHVLGIARDNKESLREKIGQGLSGDMMIVSGGVSVGDYDFVKDILKEYGIDMKFWTVGIKPGHPIAFGLVGDKPIFGLPGNPVSTMVTFEVFARPALQKMCGHTNLFRPVVDAIAEDEFSDRPGRTHYVRSLIRYNDGKYYVKSTGSQGSGILMSMAYANCFIILPADKEKVLAGETVKVQLLGRPVDYGKQPSGDTAIKKEHGHDCC